jgi:hypothetical protein
MIMGSSAFLAFYQDALRELHALSRKHGIHLQPDRGLLEEGALHLSFTLTQESALGFYGDIWRQHAETLGLPDYLEPGMNVIHAVTGDQWILLGLDPANEQAPVRLMNEMMEHFWIDIQSAKDLQPL